MRQTKTVIWGDIAGPLLTKTFWREKSSIEENWIGQNQGMNGFTRSQKQKI